MVENTDAANICELYSINLTKDNVSTQTDCPDLNPLKKCANFLYPPENTVIQRPLALNLRPKIMHTKSEIFFRINQSGIKSPRSAKIMGDHSNSAASSPKSARSPQTPVTPRTPSKFKVSNTKSNMKKYFFSKSARSDSSACNSLKDGGRGRVLLFTPPKNPQPTAGGKRWSQCQKILARAKTPNTLSTGGTGSTGKSASDKFFPNPFSRPTTVSCTRKVKKSLISRRTQKKREQLIKRMDKELNRSKTDEKVDLTSKKERSEQYQGSKSSSYSSVVSKISDEPLNLHKEMFSKEWLQSERELEEKMLKDAIHIVSTAFQEEKAKDNYKNQLLEEKFLLNPQFLLKQKVRGQSSEKFSTYTGTTFGSYRGAMNDKQHFNLVNRERKFTKTSSVGRLIQLPHLKKQY